MGIRSSVPSEGDDPGSTWDDVSDDMVDEAPAGPLGDVAFRVDRRLTVWKFVGAVAFIAVPVLVGSSTTSISIGAAVAAGLAIYGLRDLLAPVRLAVDGTGATVVTGFAGRRRLAWSEIERVRLDKRRRGTSELLEVDAGESLHFFSRYELGMPPSDALDLVRRVRLGASGA